ncbi:hypothetical protein [Longispora urticae]
MESFAERMATVRQQQQDEEARRTAEQDGFARLREEERARREEVLRVSRPIAREMARRGIPVSVDVVRSVRFETGGLFSKRTAQRDETVISGWWLPGRQATLRRDPDSGRVSRTVEGQFLAVDGSINQISVHSEYNVALDDPKIRYQTHDWAAEKGGTGPVPGHEYRTNNEYWLQLLAAFAVEHAIDPAIVPDPPADGA